MDSQLQDEVANFEHNFRLIYLRGIADILLRDWAYLSFGCIFSGTEVLAGYRYPNEKSNGARFKTFVRDYYAQPYHDLADKLWDLRNSVTHSFSPKHFALCHGKPHEHLTQTPLEVDPTRSLLVLNADNMFVELKVAFDRYFHSLQTDTNIQAEFQMRLVSPSGGGLYLQQGSSSSVFPTGNT